MNVLVSDPSGARIPGATVHRTERPAAAVKGLDGAAEMWLCDASVLSAQAPGFKTVTRPLTRPAPAKVTITLPPGDVGNGVVAVSDPIAFERPQAPGSQSSTAGAAVIPPSGATLALIGPTIQSVLTGDMLAAMPHQTVTVENGHTHASETYSGVPLVSLLESVGAPTGKDVHGKALSEYVVATGSDGYKAVIALAEAEPVFHPGQILVVDQLAGKPLDVKQGPFQLIVSEDRHPARSVHNLVKLELKSAE